MKPANKTKTVRKRANESSITTQRSNRGNQQIPKIQSPKTTRRNKRPYVGTSASSQSLPSVDETAPEKLKTTSIRQNKSRKDKRKQNLERVQKDESVEMLHDENVDNTAGLINKGQTEAQPTAGTSKDVVNTEEEALQIHEESYVQHLITFTTDRHTYSYEDMIRFADVAFLDDNHILAVDDSFLREKSGYRVCCFRLDGTLVADLQLPGYPWHVVAISPTKAVVTLRGTESRGLVWLSVDTQRSTIEIDKTLKMKQDAYGVAYNTNDEHYVVSHFQRKSMTMLNIDGVRIGSVPVPKGSTYRCMFLGNGILYLDLLWKVVTVVDLKGKEKMSLANAMLSNPTDIDYDIHGNIYVANSDFNIDPGNVCQFDASGNYIKTLVHRPGVCGIGLSKNSELLAMTHKKYIGIYKLHCNGCS